MSIPHEGACKDFVQDLLFLMVEEAREAKSSFEMAEGAHKMFEDGRVTAYHDILATCIKQAGVFQIPLRELGLEGFDPDKELFSK